MQTAWRSVLIHLSEVRQARAIMAEHDPLTLAAASDRHARALVRLADAMLELSRTGAVDRITRLLGGPL